MERPIRIVLNGNPLDTNLPGQVVHGSFYRPD